MLIAYGISKGAMSVISDKADPKKYMALGLILCALVNVLLGFSRYGGRSFFYHSCKLVS